MPYKKKLAEYESLALAPANALLKKRGEEESTSQEKPPRADAEWIIPDSFVQEYIHCTSDKKKSRMDERLTHCLNHFEARSHARITKTSNSTLTSSNDSASLDENQISTIMDAWADLCYLTQCSLEVERECLCIMIRSTSRVGMDPRFVIGEVKLVAMFLAWILRLTPMLWSEELPLTNIQLRCKLIHVVCRRLHCHHLLGMVDVNRTRTIQDAFLNLRDTIPSPMLQASLQPIELRLALGSLEETLTVCSVLKHSATYTLEKFLEHVLNTLHASRLLNKTDGVVFDDLIMEAVSWMFTLSVASAAEQSSWLQDCLALEILGELAFQSPNVLQLMQTGASASLPDFVCQKMQKEITLLVGKTPDITADPSISHWCWHHVATYLQCMERICIETVSPNQRMVAFAGRLIGSHKLVTKSRRQTERAGVKSTCEYGDGSMLGIARSTVWEDNSDSIRVCAHHSLQRLRTHALAEKKRKHSTDTMASCSSLLAACQATLSSLGTAPAADSSRTGAFHEKAPSRLQMTEGALSSVCSLVADQLLKHVMLLEVPLRSASSEASHSGVATPTQPAGSDLRRQYKTTTAARALHTRASTASQEEEVRRRLQKLELPKPHPARRLKDKVRPSQPKDQKSQYMEQQDQGVAALSQRRWAEEKPTATHRIDVDLVDDEVTTAPPPSLASESRHQQQTPVNIEFDFE